MINDVEVAKKIRDIAAAVTGVKNAQLGMNAQPNTPAAEIFLESGTDDPIAAGHMLHDQTAQFAVVFLVRFTPNLEADEELVGQLVKEFRDRLTAQDFDFTLGGVVEMTRPISRYYDVTKRGASTYRAGIVKVRVETQNA